MNMQEDKSIIEVSHVSKYFGDKTALDDVTLNVKKGEFVTILGPSGCGKTTLLRLIAGFQTASEGEIRISGMEITQTPPHKRPVNTVFQKYALFPHMNVYDNIAFGLKIKKEPKDVIEQKVNRMLKLVGLEDYGKRSITAMSGGQQQRVAIARALVNEPKVLLLDEPLGALDLKLRKEMQQELKKIQQEVGITFIYVTHDQEEALTMSDKIVVMKDGEIQQIGSPTDIYNEPVNEYVANFIGESNIIDGVMLKDYMVMFEDRKFDCVDYGFDENEPVQVVIRPEDLDIVKKSEGKLKGVVRSVLFKGVHYETIVETKKGTNITVKMYVFNEKPVVNEKAGEMMSANDFVLDAEDVAELTDADIIARASAQAWDPETDEYISISKIEYEIKAEKGTYPVTFYTSAGTSFTAKMIVLDQNKVANSEYQEEIYAVNIFKSVDEIKESIALETDLKTWANASAWSLEDGSPVEITKVEYDFDVENIAPGEYDVTFATEGYEYKVDTTDKYEVGDEVGLTFMPEDIHVMSVSR